MLLIALRDLQFRQRRFFISIVAVALVFSLTLLLAGVSASFDLEIDRTLDDLETDVWVIGEGATGPFFGAIPLAGDSADQIVGLDGVDAAAPLAYFNFTIGTEEKPGAAVFGVEPGELGAPTPDDGDPLEESGEAVVGTILGMDIGETFPMGGKEFEIVGTLDKSTLLGGTANVFIPLVDLQEIAFKGAPVITAIGVDGRPDDLPAGFIVANQDEAHEDLIRPLLPARDTITFISILLWIVAACIIGSVIYLSALERVRDFAVFKATGMSTSWMLFGLVFQAVVLSIAASLLAIVLANLLLPILPIAAELPPKVVMLLPVTAVIVSALASIAGVRRAVAVDPALAFG